MKQKNTKKTFTPDVVIVLGGGLRTGGKLTPTTQQRLDAYLEYTKKHDPTPVILSGGVSGQRGGRFRAESSAMEEYLLQHGFPKSYIVKEGKSKDTIGNAYYSKKIIRRHANWKSLLIITSDFHVARTHYIFTEIFGKKYTYKLLGAPAPHVNASTVKIFEEYLSQVCKRYYENIKSGDDKAIWDRVKKTHSYYSRSAQAKRNGEVIEAFRKELFSK
jgi:uncharacterized SAM-binding protein YcdF (DUF218 family)